MVLNARMRYIYLFKKQVQNSDSLDDQITYTHQKVFAHVSAVNGAQAQVDAIGNEYEHTFIARVPKVISADYIAFNLDTEKYTVIQIRQHATFTALYFADKQVTADELG